MVRVFAFLLVLTGCSSQHGPRLAEAPEPACGFFQSLAGYRVSWDSRTPVQLHVSSNWPDKFKSTVEKAAKIWNSANNKAFLNLNFASAAVGTSPSTEGLNGLYWMTTWSETRATEQGVTSLRFKVSHVTEADIRVNSKYFSYYDEEMEWTGQVHLTSLLVHEFGHFLGLAHQTESKSVMYPYLPANTNRSSLFDFELDALKCEYGGGTK